MAINMDIGLTSINFLWVWIEVTMYEGKCHSIFEVVVDSLGLEMS